MRYVGSIIIMSLCLGGCKLLGSQGEQASPAGAGHGGGAPSKAPSTPRPTKTGTPTPKDSGQADMIGADCRVFAAASWYDVRSPFNERFQFRQTLYTQDRLLLVIHMVNVGNGVGHFGDYSAKTKVFNEGRQILHFRQGPRTFYPGDSEWTTYVFDANQFTPGSHRVVVQVDPHSAVEELREDNNLVECNFDILPPTELPDLVITQVETSTDNPNTEERFTVNVTVTNQGNAPAVFTSGDTVVSEGRNYSIRGGKVGEYQAIGIAPGESRTFSLEPFHYGKRAGVRTWDLSVDQGNILMESDEGNNTRSFTFEVFDSPSDQYNRPDLVVTGCELLGQPNSQEAVTLRVSVTNEGPRNAGFGYYQTYLGLTGMPVHPYSGLKDGGFIVNPGEVETFDLVWRRGTLRAGQYSATVTMDPEHINEEIRRDNNSLACNFLVSPAPEQPDLRISQIRLSTENPQPGQPLGVFVTVINEGSGVAVFQHNETIISGNVGTAKTASSYNHTLEPGRSRTYEFEATLNGSMDLEFTVDPNRVLDESNGQNNTLSQGVSL